MGDFVLSVDDLKSSSSSDSTIFSICRICYEEEFENSMRLEAPCACSGTVKFAHRDCIQRWCNEKGNTTCEICLQKFEGGYTVPPPNPVKSRATVSIRLRLDVARREREVEANAEEQTLATECFIDVDRIVSCCRSVALIFTVVLLLRHLFDVVTGETKDYPFTLLTLLIIRASGVLLPMYILIRTMSAIQSSIRRHHHHQYEVSDNQISNSDDEEHQQQQQQQHRGVQMQ